MSTLVEYQQPAVTLGNTALVLGISSSLLVSGIHFGASILTVPLLYTLPADTSTRAFSKVHRGSTQINAPLTALSTSTFAISAYFFAAGDHRFHIALAHAAGLVFCSLLWTRLIMKGVTLALLDASNQVKLTDEVDQAKVERLFRKWKWMNLFKGCLTFGAGLIGLIALATRAS